MARHSLPILLLVLYFVPTCLLAQEKVPLYWNGRWDPACSKCWPSPQTKENNKCTPSDCTLQGYYRCKAQTPPLKPSNDPRIVTLIAKSQCQYVPNKAMSAVEANYVQGILYCDVLDTLSGKFDNPKPNPQVTSGSKLTFYFIYLQSFYNPGAMYLLANFYDLGLYVKQDRVKATKLMAQSANQKFRIAQYAMGVRYLYGITVPKNPTLALDWFRKAVGNNKPTDQQEIMVVNCAKNHINKLIPQPKSQ